MVFKAWDHQKTHQHIDFMHINGLIIIYHWFLNAKASTYYASGGKNPYFFVFSGSKTQNFQFFLGCRYSAGTYLILLVSISGFYCAKRELCRCLKDELYAWCPNSINIFSNIIGYIFDVAFAQLRVTVRRGNDHHGSRRQIYNRIFAYLLKIEMQHWVPNQITH